MKYTLVYFSGSDPGLAESDEMSEPGSVNLATFWAHAPTNSIAQIIVKKKKQLQVSFNALFYHCVSATFVREASKNLGNSAGEQTLHCNNSYF